MFARIKLGILILSSLMLLSGLPPAPAETAVLMEPVESGRLTGEDVSYVVGVVNPELSAQERVRIGSAVIRYSQQYAVDPELVSAVILVESAARPWAQSPKGAMGLMQVMPYMHAPMEMAGNITTIESNIEAGCRILSDNIHRLGEEDGVSAYFWGSKIRGVSYLNRVQMARGRVQHLLAQR